MRKALSAGLAHALRWRPGAYLRASAALTAWLLLRALAQALLVILLARWLGAQAYGQFVTALAITSFFTPVAGLGLSGLILRDVARDPRCLHDLLGKALALWLPAAIFCALAAASVLHFVTASTADLAVLLAFAGSEIAVVSLVELIARTAQALHRARLYGMLHTGLIMVRLAALIPLLALTPQVTIWMLVYSAVSLMYMLAVIIWTVRRFLPQIHLRLDWSMAKGGVPFVLGGLSFRLQTEFNKPVLAELGYDRAAHFGVAQRVIDLVSLPLLAMLEVLWPRYYAYAKDKPTQVRLLFIAVVCAAILAGLSLYVLAPLVRVFLGEDYAAVEQLVMALAGLPLLSVVRNLSHAWLVAQNHMSALTSTTIITTLLSLTFALILIPYVGLYGGVWAAYLTELTGIMVASAYAMRRSP